MTSTSSQTTRTGPMAALLRWLLVVMACVLMSGPGLAVAGPLEDAVSRLEAQEATTAGMLAERATLERQYRALTSRIESLKEDGGGVVDDYELQSQLREARALAEALNALDSEIRGERVAEDRLREQVIERYDTMIVELEGQLVAASPERQLEMITQLEQLQASRESFRAAVGVGSDPFEPIELPDLNNLDAADPEEILAAADELADNEEKLREQLGELRERIDALERRRRLVAYAEDSADEANLFGEEARSTRVQSSGRNGNGERPTNGTDDSANEAPPTNDGGVKTGGGVASPTTPDEAPGEDDLTASPSAPPDSFSDPQTDAENEGARGDDDGPPVIDMQPGSPGSPDLGGTPGLPPTSSGGQSGVIRSDADPNVIASGSAQGGGSLDGELRRLKAHRKRLERDIKSVQRQQTDLRERARDLER